MNLLSLFQMLGNCTGGSCSGQTAQAAQTAATAVSSMGGFSELLTMLCKLFGMGC